VEVTLVKKPVTGPVDLNVYKQKTTLLGGVLINIKSKA